MPQINDPHLARCAKKEINFNILAIIVSAAGQPD